jgi:uncharacterized membrane protein (DUF4010 family)
MAVGFQVAFTGVAIVRQYFGDAGVFPTAGLLGLTDMDALTLSMNRLGSAPDQLWLGARAIAIGVVSNTVLKLLLTVVLGRGDFRPRAALGLIALGAASAAALFLFW